MAKEKVYVTYTCKKCGCAFIDEDIDNNINEIPLKTRYCPDCVKKGYKNNKLTRTLTKQELYLAEIESKLSEYDINDKKDVKFVLKYCRGQIMHKMNTNQIIRISIILKNAIEVLGYQDWKQ